MKFYSTRNKANVVTLETAVRQGLASDGGLFLPEVFVPFSKEFWENIHGFSFPEMCFHISRQLLQGAIPDSDLKELVYNAINFDAPVVELEPKTHVLELFHGPTLAFKDFGARFMAQLLGYFNRENSEKVTILVATSGDTGGAVASGFLGVNGVEVVILYPSGKVSPLQEKQLTTLGQNIRAIEIKGNFDDCQKLVKQAFSDTDLTQKMTLSSANSINIARLVPQSFYYFEAWRQLQKKGKTEITFVVPSGNFGNLTGGLFASFIGLPVQHFVAATNRNHVFGDYLTTGQYSPTESFPTLSNAMDVGNPSNFERMSDLFGKQVEHFKEKITSYWVSDEETKESIDQAFSQFNYTADPHTAVGLNAWQKYKSEHPDNQSIGVVLSTAHPAKFPDVVEDVLQTKIQLPKELKELEHKEKVATLMETDYSVFKKWLLDSSND